MAHRISYTVKVGKIPEGAFVCHKCDNPVCINPDHLYLGDYRSNSADCVARNRQAKGVNHGRARLNERDVLLIRRMWRDRAFKLREIASLFEVSIGAIQGAIRRENWSHVP
jgi:hypothetical protein